MKKITILLLAATITAAGTAVADELEDMMKKNGCNACHSEDKKVIGPSYKDVANKYRGYLLYTSPSPRDGLLSRMPSSA